MLLTIYDQPEMFSRELAMRLWPWYVPKTVIMLSTLYELTRYELTLFELTLVLMYSNQLFCYFAHHEFNDNICLQKK